MPTPAHTIVNDARILAAYAAGQTILQIALAEGRPQESIRRALRRQSIRPSIRAPRTQPAPVAAARLNDAGWLTAEYATKSMAQIAREQGVTTTHVGTALNRAGIPARSKREAALLHRGLKNRAEIQERAAAMYLAGASVKTIAAELGTYQQMIYTLLQELHLLRSPDQARQLKRARKQSP